MFQFERTVAGITKEKDDFEVSYKLFQNDLSIRVEELESAIAIQRLHESTIKMLQDQLYDSQEKSKNTAEELATVISIHFLNGLSNATITPCLTGLSKV